MDDTPFWFSDIETDISRYPWIPVLQLPGHVVRLDVFFESKPDCDRWIQDNLLTVRFEK